MAEIKIVNKKLSKYVDKLAKATGKFYNRVLMESMTEAPYGYKYITVPVYKYYRTIKYKDYCICEECGNEHYTIRTKEIGVKKIGKKRIRVPRTFFDRPSRANKGRVIKFKRFKTLKK